MTRVLTLFVYKLRFFFGPSLRGRFGPLPYIGLTLLLLPYGYGVGFALTEAIRSSVPGQAAAFLSAPLATLLSLGFLYSLGAGVTAHVSELDYFLTSNVRPREYLLADLAFQFASLLGAGGLAAGFAAVGIVVGLGRPLATVLPLFAILLAYVFLVLLTIQILVILRVRFPRVPVRKITFVLFLLSLLPAASLAIPAAGLDFQGAWLPSSAFGSLGYSVLTGAPLDPLAAVVGPGAFGAVAAAWWALSGTYIFYGIRPSLSAGFGQIDMAARMDQQRRLIGGLGGLTTRVRLRTERGGLTGLMTRFHLIRIWRDGSVLFVLLFAVISIVSANSVGEEGRATAAIGVTQLLTLVPAILALNWSYYERENLWLALQGRRAAADYFRGLLLALAIVGSLVSAAFLALFGLTMGASLTLEELALPLAAPVAAALAATALITRLRIKPSAFSPAMLALLFLVVLGGFLGGFAAQGVLVAARLLLGLEAAAQAVLLAAFVLGLVSAGTWVLDRLAPSFRL